MKNRRQRIAAIVAAMTFVAMIVLPLYLYKSAHDQERTLARGVVACGKQAMRPADACTHGGKTWNYHEQRVWLTDNARTERTRFMGMVIADAAIVLMVIAVALYYYYTDRRRRKLVPPQHEKPKVTPRSKSR